MNSNRLSIRWNAMTDDELRDSMLRAGLSGVGLAIIFHEVEHGVRALCDLIRCGRRIRGHPFQSP